MNVDPAGALASARTLTRRVVRHYRAGRPTIRTSNSSQGPAMVYFLTPDVDTPYGGIRVMYRHVDVLNDLGIPAAVLHQKPGFRCTWFENQTRVQDMRSSAVGRHDVLVVPELDVDLVARLPRPVRHIVINQSGHLTWTRAADAVSAHYRASPELLGVVVVSEHSRDLMTYAFPGRTVHRVRLGIDPTVFYPPDEAPERVLSVLPRRGRAEVDQVLNLLRARGVLQDWRVVPLQGLSQRGFAAALRRSRMTLSLSYQEGFGLPPVEAMACGNYVVGFHGFGGREVFDPSFSAAVETGDVVAVARQVEHAIEQDAKDELWCLDRGAAAAAAVRSGYSPEREVATVAAAYRALLGHS